MNVNAPPTMHDDAPAVSRPGEAEIADAKRYLDLMRTMGDQLHIDLAENVLNDLLDRYPAYHLSQMEESE